MSFLFMKNVLIYKVSSWLTDTKLTQYLQTGITYPTSSCHSRTNMPEQPWARACIMYIQPHAWIHVPHICYITFSTQECRTETCNVGCLPCCLYTFQSTIRCSTIWNDLSLRSMCGECINLERTIWLLVEKEAAEWTAAERDWIFF